MAYCSIFSSYFGAGWQWELPWGLFTYLASTGRVSVEPSENERLTELLLIPRSNMKVILLGGLERWRQGIEFKYTHDVITYHGSNIKKNVGVTHSQDGGIRVYNIECKTVGTYVKVQLSTLLLLLYFHIFFSNLTYVKSVLIHMKHTVLG